MISWNKKVDERQQVASICSTPISLLLTSCLLAAGCGSKDQNSAPARAPSNVHSLDRILRFESTPLPFLFDRGESGAAWPVEPTGGGVGILDFDGDGDLDLFFAQGAPLPVGSRRNELHDVLLRNDGRRSFTDVSSEAGLTPKGYGQGVTVADFDGDGDSDIYVTRFGGNTLWKNERGRFVDVTDSARVRCGLWSLGAAFFDFDNDGDLDLFVANYFTFDPKQAPFARDPKTGAADYGMPARFDGQPDVLYRNEGNGTFTDITASAGVAGKGRGMGVLASDLDDDGRVDLLVANDVQHNAFWHNNGDGTFEDRAEALGLAVNSQGQVEANMGIARGDTDGDGLSDVVISHFFNEHDTLWRAQRTADGRILFQDQTLEAGLGVDSRPFTGWGIALADFDLDGRADLVVTNGHIRREPEQRYLYENPPILWQNAGNGRFRNATPSAGPYFEQSHVGRGLAVGDLDEDGSLDVVIVHHHAPSVVLWNATARPGNRLVLELRGSRGNTDAIGAKVSVKVGSLTLTDSIDGGGSYLSSNSRRLTFGLNDADKVESVEIRWPSGKTERREGLPANQLIRWEEGREPSIPRPVGK